MIDYQMLVDRIRMAIAASAEGGMERFEALSKEYAAACREINKRLDACAIFLNNGNSSEALRLADTTPHLLDLCEILKFSELDEWKEVCSTFPGMEIPVPLNQSTIDYLNEVYRNAGKAEPLLKRFRLCSLMKSPIEERLGLLYRLERADQYNPLWARLIPQYEEVCVREMETIFHSVRNSKEGGPVVFQIQKELEKLPWKKRPENLLRTIREWNRKITIDYVFNQIRILANDMHLAYMEQDFDRLYQLNKKRKNLLGEYRIDERAVPRDIADQMEPAIRWLEEQQKMNAQLQDYELCLSQMERSLSRPISPNELRALFTSLNIAAEKVFQAVPDNIRIAYERELNNFERLRRRRTTILFFSILSAILILGGSIGFYIRDAAQKKGIQSQVREITKLLDSFEKANAMKDPDQSDEKGKANLPPDYQGLDKAEKYFEKLEQSGFQQMRSPGILQAASRMETLRKRENERQIRFKKAMNDLNEILTKQFGENFEPDPGFLTAAESNVKTREEFAQYLGVKKKFDSKVSAQRRERENQFQQEITDTREAFEKIKNKNRIDQENLTKLESLHSELKNLESAHIPATLLQQKEDLLSAIGKWIQTYEKQLQESRVQVEIEQELNSLAKFADDPVKLKQEYDQLSQKYSDSPIVSDFKKTKEEKNGWKVFAAWNEFAKKNRDLWNTIAFEPRSAEKMQAELKEIKFTGTLPDEIITVQKTLADLKAAGEKGGLKAIHESLKKYFGKHTVRLWLYKPDPGSYYYLLEQPKRQQGKKYDLLLKISPFNQSSTITKEATSISTQEAPQYRIALEIHEILNTLTFSDEKGYMLWDNAIEQILQKLIRNDQGMDPVVQIIMIRSVLKILVDDPVYEKAFNSWINYFASFEDFDYEVNWYNPENESLSAQRSKTKNILENLPKLKEAMDKVRENHRSDKNPLFTQYRPVGLLFKKDKNWIVLPKTEGEQISVPLFICRGKANSNEIKTIKLDSVKENIISVPPAAIPDLIQGIPLYERFEEK
ncbi:MAG: hypothetical protein Q4G69_03745 [Planctomycetia bacterium]|nr:hypothetical protein [Planctomycetia bacterium]